MQRARHWVPGSNSGSAKPLGRLKGMVRKESVGEERGDHTGQSKKAMKCVCGGERTPSD